MDKQTRRVYAWEDKWRCFAFNDWKKGLHEPRKRIAWACRKYGVPVPTVRLAPRNRYPYWDPVEHAIYVSRHMNNPLMALHEAAHAIADWLLNEDEGDPHSAIFVGIFVWLLGEYKLAPKSALVAELDRMGARRVYGSPAAIKHRYKRRIRDTAELRAEDRLASRSTKRLRR